MTGNHPLLIARLIIVKSCLEAAIRSIDNPSDISANPDVALELIEDASILLRNAGYTGCKGK